MLAHGLGVAFLIAGINVEHNRDRVEYWLVLPVRYRDDQPSPIWLPAEVKERTALSLDGDDFVDQPLVYGLIEVYQQAPWAAGDEAGSLSG